MNTALPVAAAFGLMVSSWTAPPSPHPGATLRDSLTLVCLGNSTTAPRRNLREPYPERLQTLLRAEGMPARVHNAGKGGSHAGSLSDNAFHRIAHGSDRFRSEVVARQPDWLVVSFGINDAWQDKGRGTPSRIPLPRFRECLTAFVRSMDSIGGTTLILGPNPLGKRYEGFRKKRLDRYRKAARRLARRTGALWTDKYPLFRHEARRTGQPLDSLLLDGMHPNDTGHALVASAIRQHILRQQGRQP